MAKVTIVGQAIVLTSTLKLEDIKKVKKYRPDALILKGGEDGKEPIFAIGVGSSDVNKYGVSFEKESRDGGFATMTATTNFDGDNIGEFVADELGEVLINLGKLEEKIPGIIGEIDAERAKIMANITIA